MKRFGWSFWIDRGGTFTDCLGCDPDGDVHVTKVPSGPTAPLDGIRALMGIEATEPIAPCDVRMGTTVATNALLERSGARVGLLVTRGFGDLLEIGTTARPQLFALDIARAARLYDCVEPINVRADADGKVIAPVDEVDVLQAIERLRGQVDSVVVLVMHGHRAPQLEKQVAALARATGFEDIVLSHEAANQLGMLDRGQTAVVDAYLTPLIAQ